MTYKCIHSFRESKGEFFFNGEHISLEEFLSLRDSELKNFVYIEGVEFIKKEMDKDNREETYY